MPTSQRHPEDSRRSQSSNVSSTHGMNIFSDLYTQIVGTSAFDQFIEIGGIDFFILHNHLNGIFVEIFNHSMLMPEKQNAATMMPEKNSTK